ncbi:MAG: DUF418 domain-containing protein [Pseudoxanthomonas suwonensis]|nr:DUF418 domain-containing protein [Pseudoxanthomonas suwonensis]
MSDASRPLAARPTLQGERILALDVLRGGALLGIFLMNIEGMAGPMVDAVSGIDPRWQGGDRIADAVVHFFVQGKFYTLFSLLFGMGFVLFLDRARAGDRGIGLYVRRLLVLLAIGVLHGVLLWSGDILVGYALIGFGLLVLANVSARGLWWLGLGLFLLGPLLLLLAAAGMHAAGESGQAMAAATAQSLQDMAQAQRLAYGSGSFAQASAQRAADMVMMLADLLMFGVVLLGLFAIGAALQRAGVAVAVDTHRVLLRRLLGIGLPLGLGLMLLSVRVSPVVSNPLVPAQATAQALLMLAQLPMALGYLAAGVLALDRSTGRRALGWLAPAGRMALSNYLLQSLVATTVFHGYGLGLFDQVSRLQQVEFVLLVFVAQVLASRWWLARYRFGPAEWLWRWATYGHRPALRRDAPLDGSVAPPA